jgi:hypothetical protein
MRLKLTSAALFQRTAVGLNWTFIVGLCKLRNADFSVIQSKRVKAEEWINRKMGDLLAVAMSVATVI